MRYQNRSRRPKRWNFFPSRLCNSVIRISTYLHRYNVLAISRGKFRRNFSISRIVGQRILPICQFLNSSSDIFLVFAYNREKPQPRIWHHLVIDFLAVLRTRQKIKVKVYSSFTWLDATFELNLLAKSDHDDDEIRVLSNSYFLSFTSSEHLFSSF